MVNLNPFRSRASRSGRLLYATDGRDVLINSPDGWEVERPSLWFVGPSGGDGTGGPYGNPIPGSSGGVYGARSLPAVSRCTSLIADTIAGLPWHVLRGWDQLATPRWISDPQARRVDGRAADGLLPADSVPARLSAVDFWARWITSALWFGDGYVYVPVRDSAGQPVPPIWQLHPSAVDIDGGRYYVDDLELPPRSVIHLRGGVVHHDGHGTGVLTEHGADLGLALTVRNYAANQYTSGLPYGYVKSTQPRLTKEDATSLRDAWLQQHSGVRSIAVLNATTDFMPIGISPLDAQLDSARQWSLRDIAMAFGIPAYMLAVPGDPSTYANVVQRFIELRQFSLLPWIRDIESCLDSEFPAGTELKIKSAGLERADTATRFAAYKTAIDGGWMTPDEVRSLEDLPPMSVAEMSTTDGSESVASDAPPTIPVADNPAPAVPPPGG
jgi:HK97 family phage portal protein